MMSVPFPKLAGVVPSQTNLLPEYAFRPKQRAREVFNKARLEVGRGEAGRRRVVADRLAQVELPLSVDWTNELVYWLLIFSVSYWFLKKGNWKKNVGIV